MRTPRFVAVTALLSLLGVVSTGLVGCGDGNTPAVTTPTVPTAAKNIYVVQASGSTTILQESVLVFPASTTGTATPASTLMLPSNFVAFAFATGPQGQIYLSGIQNPQTATYGTILEYPAGSSGSATPSVMLNGSATGTGTFNRSYNIAVNSANTLVVSSQDGSVETFASGFNASSAPTQYLTWGKTNFFDGGDSIAIDTAGDIFYGDWGNGQGTKSVIDVFTAGATGAAAPVRQITGTSTTSLYYDGQPFVVADGAGDVYVAYYNQANDPNSPPAGATLANNEPTGIIEFAAGATGNATPLRRISGALTKIVEPTGMAVDAVSNLYYMDSNGTFFTNANVPSLFEVFPSSSTGNVAPATSFTSTSSTYFDDGEGGLAVY